MSSQLSLKDNGQAIVIDLGASLTKSGFSGKFVPSTVTPSLIGRYKQSDPFEESIGTDTLIAGSEALEKQGLLRLSYPSEHGSIPDFENYEYLLSTIFSNELSVDPDGRNVMLVEPTIFTKQTKMKLVQFFFEKLNVKNLYFINTALASLYASGTATGIVVESGEGSTSVTPIVDSRVFLSAQRITELGGIDITNRLKHLLRLKGHAFPSSSDWQTVKLIKEKTCFISEHLNEDRKKIGSNDFETFYTLPDHKTISINEERFLSPEILFHPLLVDCEEPAVDKLFVDSISAMSSSLRATLASSIYLSGGSTLFKGFPERLISSIRIRLQPEFPLKIKAPKDRILSPWIGAAVLASQDIVQQFWISQKKYETEGMRLFFDM
ncbi:actin-related protein, unidentified [Monocercomonoides exilis]|uniref:actin-related protein, unidentified n=1 Tax=Monocercomonoides exilis TaxID=2049356 RepID=UPI00355A3E93|nr:actin-related protein, unidentified [Monocercomonoides exilis]|eukprot:MONOS_5625.1-p1 / transcript=MONOS_5625.1 / gene=MONOS_5625 / organism=Monocercomonoides_exilis_PA203 / gene_product=actin-related protein, unidentified / transcript_product=actin-related protein, unidentified / location=Mono_scaffold00166:28670-30569(-) / protein_length=379 / sequence_SO=supercontig / SO=protein_coding / is_pseudo=false